MQSKEHNNMYIGIVYIYIRTIITIIEYNNRTVSINDLENITSSRRQINHI